MEPVQFDYDCEGVRLRGYLADGSPGRRAPGVLVAHEGTGVTEHVKQRAAMLAQAGYVAFALDMYGKTGMPLEEAREHSARLMADASLLRRRASAGLDVLTTHPGCDGNKLAVIGFCFGGTVALELARSQAPIRCAVAFHPGRSRPAGSTTGHIAAKVLMMIGSADPLVTADDRSNYEEELTDAGADWQLQVFGGVGHSYTNREVDALGLPGFRYDAHADQRAWRAMLGLLEESFRD